MSVRLKCAGAILGLAFGGVLGAERIQCADRTLSVIASTADGVESACRAMAEATRILGAIGLGTNGDVEIHLVSRLPTDDFEGAMGCYDRRDQQIHVLDLGSCRGKGRVFGMPVDEELHRSLIVHEMAHAAAARRFAPARPALAAQEYIAYVAQLGNLSRGTRERVLERYPGTGFETTVEINSTVYLIEPNYFAAQSWRHFQKPENGPAFIRRLLAGELPGEE